MKAAEARRSRWSPRTTRRSRRLADEAGVDIILVGDSPAWSCRATTRRSRRHDGRDARAHARGHARRAARARRRRHAVHVVPGRRTRTRCERGPLRQGGGCRLGQARGREARDARASHALVGAGIPVMGHIGLTPQSATLLGGFKVQGRTAEKAARACSPTRARSRRPAASRSCSRRSRRRSPRRSPSALSIPTIGIGAGAGLRRPGARLVRPARPLRRATRRASSSSTRTSREITAALGRYVDDVRSGAFPEAQHTYAIAADELALFSDAVAHEFDSVDRSVHDGHASEARAAW